MKKPTLKNLRNFAKGYFKNECPIIKRKKMSGKSGEADIKNKKIYLNPTISLGHMFEGVILKYPYKPKTDIKLREGEQYFEVLLHEIGHFKEAEKFKPPKKWVKARKRIKTEWLRLIGETKDEEYRKSVLFALVEQDDCFRQREVEEKCDRWSRIQDFVYWFLGCFPPREIQVVDWTIEEFKKRRMDIDRFLKQ